MIEKQKFAETTDFIKKENSLNFYMTTKNTKITDRHTLKIYSRVEGKNQLGIKNTDKLHINANNTPKKNSVANA